ncbi:ZnF_C2H2 protein [Aspergillus sp. HF37]|nr:ZnF_C2H2 protein [Aspergillus sp. HF37]
MTRQTSSSGWSDAHSENVIPQGYDNTGNGFGYDLADLHGIGGWQSYDPMGDTQGTGGLLAPPPLPVFPSNQAYDPSAQFNQLSDDFRSLAERVRNAAPQLNCDQLQALQDLALGAFDDAFGSNMNLNTRPASSRRTGNPQSSKMYRCYLCQHHVATFPRRGSFKKHVETQHIPNHRYHCPDHRCPFFNYRKDRVREHARSKHNLQGRRCEDKIVSRATKMPDPRTCPICQTPVNSRDEFFVCLAHHCNVSESHLADDNGSRRHEGSGGNGSGPGNQPFPGSGSGGTGYNNSQGGYGNYGGNVSSRAFYGAQGNYRGANFGHGGSPMDLSDAGQLPPNSSALPLGIDSAARDSNIHSGANNLAANTSTPMTARYMQLAHDQL